MMDKHLCKILNILDFGQIAVADDSQRNTLNYERGQCSRKSYYCFTVRLQGPKRSLYFQLSQVKNKENNVSPLIDG